MAWLGDVGFFIKDAGEAVSTDASAFAPGMTGPAPTQGFSLNRDEAQNMLTQAKATRDDLRALTPDAEKLTKMKPPADEIASNAYNAAYIGAGGSPGAGGYGAGHIQKEYAYMVELIERLERALGITEDTDQQAGSAVKAVSTDTGLA
ncbi:MAG: hypothetical protein JWQ81_8478 [Amycolatopsis sp.]|uniref:hypothetical protein n=1 Tax=Amycolatopsis sp. TaxID=37632 RepID=UPI0026316DF1|nr:hypothetical protein [Amycolatopsis sp.]MCU1687739.1 hypothetical protein [Amycolatopsis sp.]